MNVTTTYYAGEAFVGYGAELLVGQGVGSPDTYVAIADVDSIQFGEMSTEIVDKTHLRSPDAHREKMATIRDSGAFTITGNWRLKHGSHSNAGGDGFTGGGLIKLWRTRAERDFKLILADGSPATEVPFRGVVSRYQPGNIALNEKVNFTAEITPLRDFSATLP